MEGELDGFDFVLAERLGMTVQQMRDAMPNNEYHQWRAFYDYRDAMAELQMKQAEAKQSLSRQR